MQHWTPQEALMKISFSAWNSVYLNLQCYLCLFICTGIFFLFEFSGMLHIAYASKTVSAFRVRQSYELLPVTQVITCFWGFLIISGMHSWILSVLNRVTWEWGKIITQLWNPVYLQPGALQSVSRPEGKRTTGADETIGDHCFSSPGIVMLLAHGFPNGNQKKSLHKAQENGFNPAAISMAQAAALDVLAPPTLLQIFLERRKNHILCHSPCCWAMVMD